MNYCHVKESGNVFVYLVLLLLTCAKSPSACDFEYTSVTGYFEIKVNNTINILFNDYDVLAISNFELDNRCLWFWHILDSYTILQNLTGKAEIELKKQINNILTELSMLQNCSFFVPETCIKQKRPLVQVLKEFNFQQVESINEVHSSCIQMRCDSGNTIAHEPVDHHYNITTKYSTKGQNAGTVPNYEDYLQQKRESSNKTEFHQDNNNHTSQFNVKAFIIAVVVLIAVMIPVLIYFFKKRPCGVCGNHHNTSLQYRAGRPDDTNHEA